MISKIKKVVIRCLATTYFQPIYETLHYIALKGMNFGSANSPLNSGEVKVLKMLQTSLPNNPVIFDVGANNGQYLSLILKYFKAQHPIVHVFEPDQLAFKKLEKRYANTPNVFLNNVALGSVNEIATLYSSKVGGVDASLVHTEDEALEKHAVTVTRLDDYCIKNGIPAIDFLKIDVEGFEIEVLKGGQRYIDALAINHIQFEHGSMQSIIAGATLHRFITLLKNYQCFHIKQNGIYKVTYAPIKEVFYNSNYYFKRRD